MLLHQYLVPSTLTIYVQFFIIIIFLNYLSKHTLPTFPVGGNRRTRRVGLIFPHVIKCPNTGFEHLTSEVGGSCRSDDQAHRSLGKFCHSQFPLFKSWHDQLLNKAPPCQGKHLSRGVRCTRTNITSQGKLNRQGKLNCQGKLRPVSNGRSPHASNLM